MLEFSRLLSAYKLFDPGMSVAMRWDDQIMRRTQPFVPLSCFLSTVSPPYLPQPVSCHPLMELTVSDARGNGWRVVGISFAMWFLPETVAIVWMSVFDVAVGSIIIDPRKKVSQSGFGLTALFGYHRMLTVYSIPFWLLPFMAGNLVWRPFLVLVLGLLDDRWHNGPSSHDECSSQIVLMVLLLLNCLMSGEDNL